LKSRAAQLCPWQRSYAGIVQAITEGGYRPNPNADKFSVEFTISEIDKIKSSSAFGLR